MESSHSEFAEFFRNLRMPDNLLDAMREAPGPVLSGETLIEAVKDASFIITVGDYCTKDMIDKGHPPRIAIVDFKTKREAMLDYAKTLEAFGDVALEVINPPGTISKEAWLTISEAFKSMKRVRVDIRGEEDLLALVCVALAPIGSVVIYGMPGKGAVVVHVDKTVKGKVRDILKRMV